MIPQSLQAQAGQGTKPRAKTTQPIDMQRQFLLDRVCCTGLPIYQYAAQGLQICSAQSLQICSAQNQINQECDAQRLHIGSAQGLQICFAPCLKMCCGHNPQMPIQMLHMVCKHNICAAQGLQICCTGPAPIFHRAPNMLHKSRKYVLREACRYAAQGLPRYAAQSLQI